MRGKNLKEVGTDEGYGRLKKEETACCTLPVAGLGSCSIRSSTIGQPCASPISLREIVAPYTSGVAFRASHVARDFPKSAALADCRSALGNSHNGFGDKRHRLSPSSLSSVRLFRRFGLVDAVISGDQTATTFPLRTWVQLTAFDGVSTIIH